MVWLGFTRSPLMYVTPSATSASSGASSGFAGGFSGRGPSFLMAGAEEENLMGRIAVVAGLLGTVAEKGTLGR